MKLWEDKYKMTVELLQGVTDIVLDSVISTLNKQKFNDIHGCTIACWTNNHDMPQLMFFSVPKEDGESNDSYALRCGDIVGSTKAMLSAAYLVKTIDKGILDGEIEIIGGTPQQQFMLTTVNFSRDLDTGSIVVYGDATKIYHPETQEVFPPGDTVTKSPNRFREVDMFMVGYITKMHIAFFGAPPDPNDPQKYIRSLQEEEGVEQ